MASEKKDAKPIFNLNAGEDSPSPFMPSPLRGKGGLKRRRLSLRSNISRASPQSRIFDEIIERAKDMKD